MEKRKHHDLQVWQLGMRLVRDIYAMTRQFPGSEKYGLCSQMQRAAVSIPSNIAEGAARSGDKDARASLCELETQIMIAHDLGFIKDSESVMALVNELFARLSALIQSTRKKAINHE